MLQSVIILARHNNNNNDNNTFVECHSAIASEVQYTLRTQNIINCSIRVTFFLISVFLHCCLGDKKGILSVKIGCSNARIFSVGDLDSLVKVGQLNKN